LKIIQKPTSLAGLWESRESLFDGMIKIVVDVKKEIIGADAELHADLEQILIEQGSRQEDLWGANIYPLEEKTSPDFLEYRAMINIRPAFGNRSMELTDLAIRDRIHEIVHRLLV
jgi:hypothetical protein